MFPQSSSDEMQAHRAEDGVMTAPVLPAQYAELLETVWSCERAWRLEDRIDSVVRYGTGR